MDPNAILNAESADSFIYSTDYLLRQKEESRFYDLNDKLFN